MSNWQVLVIGSGGREHALAWKIRQSPLVAKVFCAPGNGGTQLENGIENIAIQATQIDELLAFALRQKIDLTVVGPEQPLVAGLVDRFEAKGLKIFGPSQRAAQLEGSKVFAKERLRDAKVPTASFQVAKTFSEAESHLKTASYPVVLKADGLAAGKGVVVCESSQVALNFARQVLTEGLFGKNAALLIEAFLPGIELSVLALCSGEQFTLLMPARDHKRLQDQNRGPNTGGMGAFTPVADATPALMERVATQVFRPILATMKKRQEPFFGVLYAGLMIQGSAFHVLEFNVRFGDPEAEPLLFQMQGDLVPHLMAIAEKKWCATPLTWHPGVTLAVVLASANYPTSSGDPKPLAAAQKFIPGKGCKLFHAATQINAQGKLYSNGGRVLVLTCRDANLVKARATLYQQITQIEFEGAQYRRDIGL